MIGNKCIRIATYKNDCLLWETKERKHGLHCINAKQQDKDGCMIANERDENYYMHLGPWCHNSLFTVVHVIKFEPEFADQSFCICTFQVLMNHWMNYFY